MKKINSNINFSGLKEYFSNLFDRDSAVFNPRPDIAWFFLRLIFAFFAIAVFLSTLSIVNHFRRAIEEEPSPSLQFTEQDLGRARTIVADRLSKFENLLATSSRAVDPSR